MSDIEPVKESSILDKVKDIQEAGILHVKGYSNHEIASLLSIPSSKAKEYVAEYKKIVQDQADKDPYFLEKLQYNTIKALDEFDQISKEAWETVSIATDHGMVAQRIQALKLAGEETLFLSIQILPKKFVRNLLLLLKSCLRQKLKKKL